MILLQQNVSKEDMDSEVRTPGNFMGLLHCVADENMRPSMRNRRKRRRRRRKRRWHSSSSTCCRRMEEGKGETRRKRREVKEWEDDKRS